MPLYYFFDDTNKETQAYLPVDIDRMKERFKVQQSRCFGDYDCFLHGKKVGTLFSDVDKFSEHLTKQGF